MHPPKGIKHCESHYSSNIDVNTPNSLKAESQHFKSIVSFEIQHAGGQPKQWKAHLFPNTYRLHYSVVLSQRWPTYV